MPTPATPTATPARGSTGTLEKNHRILVVDDSEAIHEDFRKILSSNASDAEFEAEEAAIFGEMNERIPHADFSTDFAFQGEQALELVKAAVAAGRRYATVFMDVRMPPGWDGLETTLRLWEEDPDLQIVICTAYSDYSWDEMMERVRNPERLLVLKKPFDTIEVLQMANALTEKWSLLQAAKRTADELEETVQRRTRALLTANSLLQAEMAKHKATGLALRRTEQELAEFFNNASVGLHQLGPDGVILRANRAELELLGFAREAYEGRKFTDFLVDREIAAQLLARLGRGETLRDFEIRMRCGDDTIKYVLLDSNALWENHQIVYSRCFLRDNTARKQAEERVREQAALLEKARDAMIVRDLNDTIVFWNKGAENLYGWTAEEAIGMSVLDLMIEDEDEFYKAKRIIAEKGGWTGQLLPRTKDRQQVNVECRWTLVRDELGHPKAIFAIDSDITEKKELEAQCLRAQRMESIGALAGGIAHDLNNLLGPLVLGLELVAQQPMPAEGAQVLEVMSMSTSRAVDIVRQLLCFARGAEGEKVEVHTNLLLRELEKIARETFPRSIRMTTSLPERPWALLGDPTQLHQVLLNLCVNARDAMPEGGLLTVSAENVQVDEHYTAAVWDLQCGPHLLIKVSDTGTGIPQEIMEKIFEPFFTTKQQGQGTGLGLSTVFGIVKNHGGAIKVTSEVGCGTTFSIYLPAVVPKELELAPASPAGETLRGQGELILVVDDEVPLLNVTKRTLESSGYRVLAAADGVEALAHFAQSQSEVALVVTDMMMPHLDGPATVRALKKMSPDLPIIGMSGGGTTAHEIKARSAGVNLFVPKPFCADELLRSIRSALHPQCDALSAER